MPFPGPDIDPLWFDVDELIKQLEENESEIRLGLTKDLISVSHFLALDVFR